MYLSIEKLIIKCKVHAVIGVLGDDADPMVTVMKLEKAPQETYADIGGLDQQIQEIKVLKNAFFLIQINQFKFILFLKGIC